MSEATPPDAGANPTGADFPGIPVRMHGQYVKDMSFEVPNAPDIFREMRQTQPEIQISLDTGVRNLQGNVFEVTLSVKVDAAVGAKKAFILELSYCSFVEFAPDMPEEHKHPMLLIEVPRQMFPFVRQIVSSTTSQSGFPPMMLEMIDFGALYRSRFGDQPPQPEPAAQPAVH